MKQILFLFFSFLFSFQIMHAQIHETSYFKEVIDHLSEGDLLLLDIDDTLLITKQMLGCDEWFQYKYKQYKQEGLSPEEALKKALNQWIAIRKLTDMELVEPQTDDHIQDLQEKGFQVMGLTTQSHMLSERTNEHLKQVSIHLQKTAPSQKDHYFVQEGRGVLYRHGILFTAGTHKGQALIDLLEILELRPKKIVFINDKESHLKEVEVLVEQYGIPFVGLRYAYSDEKKSAFCPKIAEIQFTHSSFDQILSDAQARDLLELLDSSQASL